MPTFPASDTCAERELRIGLGAPRSDSPSARRASTKPSEEGWPSGGSPRVTSTSVQSGRAGRQADAGAKRALFEEQEKAIIESAQRPVWRETRRLLQRAPLLLPRALAPFRTLSLDAAVFIGPAADWSFGTPTRTSTTARPSRLRPCATARARTSDLIANTRATSKSRRLTAERRLHLRCDLALPAGRGGTAMKSKVFISIGSACSPLHSEAAEAIFRVLETAGFSPRQMDKTEWSVEQPLSAIKRVIDECEGVVVVAFSRYHFASGTERKKGGGDQPLHDVRLPTVWNQIEAALGYARGLPLFVIAEDGLLESGLLEGRYDWKVCWTDFKRDWFQSKEFVGYLKSWRQLIVENAASRSHGAELDIAKTSIGQVVRGLSVPQLWSALSAIVGLLIGVATIAYRTGAGKWPWQ